MPAPGVNPIPNQNTPPTSPQASPGDALKGILNNGAQGLSVEHIQALIKILQALSKANQGAQQKPAEKQAQNQAQQLPPQIKAEAPKLLNILNQALQQKQPQAEAKKPTAQNPQAAANLAQAGKGAGPKTTPMIPTTFNTGAMNILQGQQKLPPQAMAQALLTMLADPKQAAQVARLLQGPQGMQILLQSFNLQSANPQMAQALMQTLSHLMAGQKLPPNLQGLAQLAGKALAALGQPGQSLAQLASSQPQAFTALLMTLANPQGASLSRGGAEAMLASMMLLNPAQVAQGQPMVLSGNEALLATLAAMFALQNRRTQDDGKKDKGKKKLFALDGTSEVYLGDQEEEEDDWEEEEEKRTLKRKQKREEALKAQQNLA